VRVRRVDQQNPGWELDWPAYRVRFWTRPAHSNAAFTSAEFEIIEADVADALTWAQRTAGNRVFVLYAVCDLEDTKVLVRLAGQDPTRAPGQPGRLARSKL
jgi:hypothetical protein